MVLRDSPVRALTAGSLRTVQGIFNTSFSRTTTLRRGAVAGMATARVVQGIAIDHWRLAKHIYR